MIWNCQWQFWEFFLFDTCAVEAVAWIGNNDIFKKVYEVSGLGKFNREGVWE